MPATFSLLTPQPQVVDLSQSDVCTYPIPLLLVAGSHWNVQLSTLPASRAIVGALFDTRAENRLPRKVALNERQTMFRVMNVRCSHRRVLAFFPFSLSLFLSRSFAPTRFTPPWLETYVDVRGIHGSLIRSFAEHRQQQLPLPLYPLCILTGRRMTDQLRGNVRPRILTPEYAAYLLQSLCSNRAVVVRPVDWSRLWRLTSDKSRGPFLGWGRVVDYSIERRPSCSDMKSTLLLP